MHRLSYQLQAMLSRQVLILFKTPGASHSQKIGRRDWLSMPSLFFPNLPTKKSSLLSFERLRNSVERERGYTDGAPSASKRASKLGKKLHHVWMCHNLYNQPLRGIWLVPSHFIVPQIILSGQDYCLCHRYRKGCSERFSVLLRITWLVLDPLFEFTFPDCKDQNPTSMR